MFPNTYWMEVFPSTFPNEHRFGWKCFRTQIWMEVFPTPDLDGNFVSEVHPTYVPPREDGVLRAHWQR